MPTAFLRCWERLIVNCFKVSRLKLLGQMDSKQRFSNRVNDYVLYRPHYPAILVSHLEQVGCLKPDSHVVDIGSGTGLLARIFLEQGYAVTGIEPNTPMREAGEIYLRNFGSFACLNGSAESTGIADSSVDLVVAGQAFHWFEPKRTRAECLRIGRADAHAAMIWNERHLCSDFMSDYEALLLRYAPDYRQIQASHVDEQALSIFFGGGVMSKFLTPNHQSLDLEGIKGRLASSSYAPLPGMPGHDDLFFGIEQLFER